MSGWAGDQAPQPYPDDPMFIRAMPVESPTRPAPTPRRGKPGCEQCQPDEACSRHSYDPVKSLGIGPRDPQDRVRWTEIR